MVKSVRIIPVMGIPLIKRGDNLGQIIKEQCIRNQIIVKDDDIIVVAQKIISKSEGLIIRLKNISPSKRARELSNLTGRDPRLCQVYLDESSEIISIKGRMVIARHKFGFICSSAGVDRSNVAPRDKEMVALLPRDPDNSAKKIREYLKKSLGKTAAVIINDSFGREGRDGSVGIAIGIAGISHLESRKQKDIYENESNSRIAIVDELAAAASIIMGQANERIPVVIIRGVSYTREENASIKKILA